MKKTVGYIFIIAGLGLIAWNAYTYFSGKYFERITTISGPLLFLLGVAVIKKDKRT